MWNYWTLKAGQQSKHFYFFHLSLHTFQICSQWSRSCDGCTGRAAAGNVNGEHKSHYSSWVNRFLSHVRLSGRNHAKHFFRLERGCTSITLSSSIHFKIPKVSTHCHVHVCKAQAGVRGKERPAGCRNKVCILLQRFPRCGTSVVYRLHLTSACIWNAAISLTIYLQNLTCWK